MIHSMTAFARLQNQGEWGNLICEIRSINHRFLEIGVFLPESLRVIEMGVRDRIKNQIKRGKIECAFRYQSNPAKGHSFTLNNRLVEEVCQLNESVVSYLKDPARVNPMEVLRFPGILETKELDLNIVQTELYHLLENTLKELILSRQREGEELKRLLLQKTEELFIELTKIRGRIPQVIADQQERMRKRFKEVMLDLQPERLEQEMVLYTQKTDIIEELERAETHLKEIKRVLKEGGVVGRRLDFLLQEFNREANTLGSKSVDVEITHGAVEMKVLLEQMREQIQNLE